MYLLILKLKWTPKSLIVHLERSINGCSIFNIFSRCFGGVRCLYLSLKMSVPAPMKQIWKFITESKVGFDQVLKKVNLVSAGNGTCTAEMIVEPEHTNSNGTLHGGLTTTIVDVISGLALSTHREGGSGVSVNLNVTFLNAVRLGELIVIEAKTNKSGKNLAFLDVVIRQKSSGLIVATGSHIKYIGFK